MTVRPGAVADVIESNIRAAAERLGIQERSAWRYFDAAALAESIARKQHEFERSSEDRGVGPAMPPIDNPELAVILAGVPDDLERTGGDLYAVLLNVVVNAWKAGHIHGEDGCAGCDDSRGDVGHDWQARMNAITALQPDVTKWFDRDVWTAALHDSGYSVTRA